MSEKFETETLDKLYLEWSQFTQARTARELNLESAIHQLTEHVSIQNGKIESQAEELKFLRQAIEEVLIYAKGIEWGSNLAERMFELLNNALYRCPENNHDFKLIKQDDFAKHYKCKKCGTVGWG
jgi:hypothetical protein